MLAEDNSVCSGSCGRLAALYVVESHERAQVEDNTVALVQPDMVARIDIGPQKVEVEEDG